MSPRRDNHTHFFSEETSESHGGGALVMWLKIGGRGAIHVTIYVCCVTQFFKEEV